MQWSDITKAPPRKTLRQFAGLFLVFFVALGVSRAFRAGAWSAFDVILAAAGMVIGLLGLIRPGAIRWIFTGWMIAVFPIGWTVSNLMLALLFYGLFTPVAAVFKIIKRDALRRKRPGRTDTFWTAKPQPTDSRDYLRQF